MKNKKRDGAGGKHFTLPAGTGTEIKKAIDAGFEKVLILVTEDGGNDE